MEVSFSIYIIGVIIFSSILALIRYKTKDETYGDTADLSVLIGCILFWPFVASMLLVGIAVLLILIPFIIIATLISWLISLFDKNPHG